MGRGTEKEEGVNKQHPRVQSCLIPLIGTQPTRIQGFSNNLICQLGFVGLGFFEVFFFWLLFGFGWWWVGFCYFVFVLLSTQHSWTPRNITVSSSRGTWMQERVAKFKLINTLLQLKWQKAAPCLEQGVMFQQCERWFGHNLTEVGSFHT